MENASKALLIAGALLIAILLISLGVVLFNKSGDFSKLEEKAAESIDKASSKGINTIVDNITLYNSGKEKVNLLVSTSYRAVTNGDGGLPHTCVLQLQIKKYGDLSDYFAFCSDSSSEYYTPQKPTSNIFTVRIKDKNLSNNIYVVLVDSNNHEISDKIYFNDYF